MPRVGGTHPKRIVRYVGAWAQWVYLVGKVYASPRKWVLVHGYEGQFLRSISAHQAWKGTFAPMRLQRDGAIAAGVGFGKERKDGRDLDFCCAQHDQSAGVSQAHAQNGYRADGWACPISHGPGVLAERVSLLMKTLEQTWSRLGDRG